MSEYVVVRDQGYPVEAPTHKHHEVIELDGKAAADGVKKGYLLPVDPESPAFTVEMATIVAAHRKAKAEAAAAQKALDEEAEKVAKAAADKAAEDTKALLEKQEPDTRLTDVQKILGVTPDPPKQPPARTTPPVKPKDPPEGATTE